MKTSNKLKNLLIITCIYNNQPLVEQCFQSVLNNTNTENINCTYMLVNNHPPNKGAINYLETYDTLKHPVIKAQLIDPGENVGCHRGFNYGYNYAVFGCGIKPDYIVKLDDDTVVPQDWNLPMMDILDKDPSLAYISSIDQNAKQGSNFKVIKVDKYHLEIPQTYNVGFSCVMFPARTIDRFGLLMNRETLYGDEEAEYHRRVKAEGQYGAYIQEVTAQHLPNTDRDIDYIAWKYWYGLVRKTTKDLVAFKADRQELIKCWTHMLTRPIPWWQEQAEKRLNELKWWKWVLRKR